METAPGAAEPAGRGWYAAVPERRMCLVFDAAAAVAHATPNWEVTKEDRGAGVIEAVATTPLMRFKDDVTITVAADGSQTTVVVRSHSRVGKGDLGANAKRIRKFQEDLGKQLGAG